MTVVCATSEDLAAVKKLIAALDERLEKRTVAVDSCYGKRITVLEATSKVLEARVNQMGDRAEYDEPAPVPSAAWADCVGPGLVCRVQLTTEMCEALTRFRNFRSHGWKETVSLEEAIRRMLDAGLRSYGLVK